MADEEGIKSATRQILIVEPDEVLLRHHLAGRTVSPGLDKFLSRLVSGKKWPRKINIPSTHDNLAAALVFSTELKEGGLEIYSELHVFFDGETRVEKWPVAGERDEKAALPKETFTSIEIEKVRLHEGKEVQVTLRIPVPEGVSQSVVRTFDFADGNGGMQIVAPPAGA